MRMMSDGKGRDLLASLKMINCASHHAPKTLLNHIKRAKYIARMWKRADETNPTGDASPTDYGWKLLNQNCFEPDWFQFRSPSQVNPHHLQMQTVILRDPMKRNQNQTRLGVTVMRMMRKCDEQKKKHFFKIKGGA